MCVLVVEVDDEADDEAGVDDWEVVMDEVEEDEVEVGGECVLEAAVLSLVSVTVDVETELGAVVDVFVELVPTALARLVANG